MTIITILKALVLLTLIIVMLTVSAALIILCLDITLDDLRDAIREWQSNRRKK